MILNVKKKLHSEKDSNIWEGGGKEEGVLFT